MISYVEFRLYNLAATTFTLLKDFKTATFDVKYNELGALNMDYPLAEAKAAGLGDNSHVGVVVGFSDGTSEEVERYLVKTTNDSKVIDGKRMRTLTGKSSLVFLEDAKVYPSNWPVTAPTGHEFVDQSVGTIWRTLIARAKARGGLPHLIETTFSGPTDSNGSPWNPLTISPGVVPTGTAYLAFLRDHMDKAFADAYMEGWTLKLLNGGTRGSHIAIGDVEVRPAYNVSEMLTNTDTTDSSSTVLVEGEEGTVIERHSASAQTLLGRRVERFVSQGGIADSGVLNIIGDAELALFGKIPTEETVGVVQTLGLTPFQDFKVADWIWVRYETSEVPVERRVRQLGVSVDADRNISLGITLNSILYENDIRLQRKIEAYAGSGGNYGQQPNTGVDNTVPNSPTGLSVSSTPFLDSTGQYVAAASATWVAPTTNVDGSTIKDLGGYEVQWRYVGDTNWSFVMPSDDSLHQWSPVAPGRQIQVQVRAVDTSGHRSGWSATQTHTVAIDTTAPAQPSTPLVSNKIGAIEVKWDGLASSGGMDTDVVRVEVWRSGTSGFTPQDPSSSLAASLLRGGDAATLYGPYATNIYVKLVAVDRAGNRSPASAQAQGAPVKAGSGDIEPGATPSDGNVPTAAPADVSVIGGVGALFVRWTPITNIDPVEYEVHIAKNPNFTPDYAGGGTGPEWFENFSGDLSRWPASYGDRVIVSGRCRLTTDAGVYSGIATNTRFDLTNDVLSAQIEPQATPGATQEVIFTLRHDADNLFSMIKSATNTSIICRSRVGGTNSDQTVSVTTGQIYWRFREATGTIHFEVSTNGSSWSTLRSVSHGMAAAALSSMVIDISAGDSDSGSVLPDLQVMVDNVSYSSEVLSATLATVTPGASHTIRTLPNGMALDYDIPYWVKVVAKDPDGYGPFSVEDSDQMVRAGNDDISTNYLYAGNIFVDQLVGGTLSADVTLSAVISTRIGGVGAGVDVGPFGISTYDSDSSPSIVLPSDPDQPAYFKGEVEAAGLTVTGKASFRAADNEVATSGALILASAITKPQSPPTVVVDWPVFPLTGATVDMSKVYSCNYINDGVGGWVGFQVMERIGVEGYMIRQFDADGTYDQTLVYKPDGVAGSEFGAGFRIGNNHYTVERLIKSGQVWIRKEDNLGTWTSVYYNRVNPNQLPIIGWDGTNILIAEFDATNLRFRIQTMNPTTMALTGTTMTTTTNPGFSGPLYGVVRGNFDLGASRTIVLAKNAPHAWPFNSSGTYQPNEAFPVKSPDSRGLGWDGTRFWSFTAFGQLVKHAPAAWNDANDPQTWYATTTWYDSDAGGTGTHETDMGPVGTFSMRRRAWLTLASTQVPDLGGTDDPDRPRFYVGKVNTSRTNLWKQTDPGSGVRSLTYETVTFSGTNPPASNNFPAATPAKIQSQSGAMVISGDGKITDAIWTETTGYTSFTPSWTATTTNPVLNNGTFAAKYRKLGRTVIATYKLVVGSTTTVGSGIYKFSLPPGLPSADNEEVAMALFLDSSASTAGYRTMSAIVETSDTLIFLHDTGTSAGAWSNTFPVTLAAGDIMRVTAIYETTVA